MVMKKNIIIAGAIILVSLMSGCDRMNLAAINDSDYDNYQKYLNMGKLDEQGYYSNSTFEEYWQLPDENEVVLTEEVTEVSAEPRRGNIHVTFSDNSFINVKYFFDKDRKEEIDTKNCWVNAGDSIYADIIDIDNAKSNLYRFDEFKVWKITDNNRILQDYPTEDGAAFTVPVDFSGSDLQIEPVGEYLNRSLDLCAYEDIGNGNLGILGDVSWTVNGEPYTKDEGISSVVSYNVECKYDKDNYYVVATSPKCYGIDEQNGLVVFHTVNPLQDVDSFSVTLCKKHVFRITGRVNEGLSKIMCDNQTEGQFIYDDEKNTGSTRVGDTLIIDVKSGYELRCSNQTLSEPTFLSDSQGYRYQLKVQYVDSGLLDLYIIKDGEEEPLVVHDYDLKDLSGQHGKMKLYISDTKQLIEPGYRVAKNQNVTFEIIPDDGYYVSDDSCWIKGEDVQNDCFKRKMTYGQYLNDRDSLIEGHPIKKIFSMNISTSDIYGEFTVRLNQNKVMENTVVFREEDVLTIEYTISDPGYKIAYTGWGESDQKKVMTIPIQDYEKLDGKTLYRSTYITVIKREG